MLVGRSRHTQSMPTTASARDLLRWRLAAQRVSPRGPGVENVVGDLLAIQAQDFAQGLWAVGARTSATRASVFESLDYGDVVRSWPMRGTLHFVRASDLRWMLVLTAARTTQSLASRHHDLGLDSATFARATDAAIFALAGGGRLGRSDFLDALEHAGIRTDGQRAPHLIGQLARRQVVVWGPSAGAQQAVVLFDEWVPAAAPIDRESALSMFVTGYLRGHGPATVRDFAWWSGLTLADARAGFESARDELEAVDVDGAEYWMLAASAHPDVGIDSEVHLLAGFDEYLLGYKDRSHPLAAEHAGRVVPGKNGIFLATIVSNGRIVGTWRRAITRDVVTVTIDPFEPLSRGELAGVEREVARFGRFHGLPARLG